MRKRIAVCAISIGLLATLPAAAHAGKFTVYAGDPQGLVKPIAFQVLGKKVKAVVALHPSANDFFLHRVTIHTGDQVSFINAGFHTIDLPGSSNKDLPFSMPTGTVSGAKDAAGNPFWFNGQPSEGFNPALFTPSGPKTYDGTTRIDSGLPLGNGKPKPLVVTFTKPGVYKYFCDLHAGMVGYVVVKPKSKPVPSAAQDAAALHKQIATEVITAYNLTKTKVPKDTVDLGAAGPAGVELYAMFPAKLTVNAGTVVTFRMTNASEEQHTATFGPASYLKTLEINGPVFPAPTFYPSDAKPPVVLTSSSHGNGFANTGILANDPSLGLPKSATIQLTQVGTYTFICLIHPFMRGTIVVK